MEYLNDLFCVAEYEFVAVDFSKFKFYGFHGRIIHVFFPSARILRGLLFRLPWFQVVTVPTGRPFVKEDQEDDKFIWCAVKANADAIISGGDHLLKFNGSLVPIYTVSGFLGM